VFVLADDPELVRRQLRGEELVDVDVALAERVSTDEMAPGWASYYFDERLGHYALVGFRGGVIGEGAVAAGGFDVLVGGESFGFGSSRETAPYAQLVAGIRLVVARSFAPIYRQNCENIGLWTTTDFSLLARLRRGEAISREEIAAGLDPLSREVALSGGLLAHAKRRLAGGAPSFIGSGRGRAMTLVEKIIARHAVLDPGSERVGVDAVSPGDALFVRADWRFSHEYVTPMADAILRRALGGDARVAEPERVLLFRDHLTFVRHVLERDPKRLPLLEQAELLPRVQAAFAERHGIRLLGEVSEAGVPRGSHAICHEEIVEAWAEPGTVVVGSDSHTSTAGALGCLAFGVGATDMAQAFVTRDVRLSVPETVRVVVAGRLPAGTTAKDAMLTLFSSALVRAGGATGRVLEFSGPGLSSLSLDERATLANMAVEAGALTGIVAADDSLIAEVSHLRGVNAKTLAAKIVAADAGADYAGEVTLDLDGVEPMLALPGDPRRVMALSELSGPPPRLTIAYGGTCTGSKRADLDFYAEVLAPAAARGERVAESVNLFVQLGSQRVRRHAEARGYLAAFEKVGATLIDPACGACIGAGPGVSRAATDVTVSAGSRNFPGRSGPGKVYLASPLVVAESALSGELTSPASFRGRAA
jgi:3-isopropylmalate/(R)-2-methylmalate dehydratase large subunit